jgi:microcystin-dependent protein
MPKVRRQFAGGAAATTLTGSIAASGVTTFSIAASTNWSTSTTIPFYVVLSPQTASEEKMLVTLSSNTLTIVSRGVDGTSASSHASGATIYPVFTAIDANEANELTAKYANRGSIVYQGASTFEELPKGTQGHALVIGANDPAWGQVDTVGIKDDAVTSGKILNLAVIEDKINNNAVTLAKLATAVQNFLVPVGTICAYPGATAPTGWLLCNGTTTTGYTALAALVGSTTPDLRGHTLVGKGSAPFDGALLSKLGSTTSTAAHSHSIDHDHGAFDTTGGEGAHGHIYNAPAVGTNPLLNESDTSVSYAFTATADTTGTAGAHNHSINPPNFTGTSGGSSVGSTHGNVQPSALINYIIKHD